MNLQVAAASDRGKVRERNEDSWNIVLDRDQHPVGLVVADGMGGHEAGEVASRIAVAVLSETLAGLAQRHADADEAMSLIAEGVDEANRRIISYSTEYLQNATSGTTLTAGFWHSPSLLVAHIGDSRAYLCREGNSSQITRDHSYVQELLHRGAITPEDAKKHPDRHKITRALGAETQAIPDFYPVHPQPGDVLVLCTDGLHDTVALEEIEAAVVGHTPEEAAGMLVDLANARGGNDNITVLVALVCA